MNNLENLYANNYEEYTKEKKKNDKIRLKILKENIRDKKKVLDIGCRNCIFKEYLTKEQEYHGIDIREREVQKAQQKGLNVKQCTLGKDKIPYPTSHFDAIIAGEIFEHIPNLGNALEEVYRTLKPDGIFTGSTPNAKNPSIFLTKEKEEQHIISFQPGTLKNLLKLHNFNTIITGDVFLFGSTKLAKIFPQYAYHIIFKARKQ